MATKKVSTTEATDTVEEVVEEVVKEVAKYTKIQIAGSKKFRKEKDLLNALLDDNTVYTIGDIEEMLQAFKKGKVK